MTENARPEISCVLFKRKYSPTGKKPYWAWWFYWIDADGKKNRRPAYHRNASLKTKQNKDAAEAFMREALAELKTISHVMNAQLTLEEYAGGMFLPGCPLRAYQIETRRAKEGTIANHRHYLTDYILQQFGTWRLMDITARPVEEWLRGLKLSTSTLNTILDTFNLVLKESLRDRHISGLPGFRRFRRHSAKRDILSAEELQAVFPNDIRELIGIWAAQSESERDSLMYAVAGAVTVSAGLRPGECRALSFDQVFFDLKGLYINRQIDSSRTVALPKKGTEDRPRDRVIAVPTRTVELISLLQTRYPTDSEFMFTLNGRILSPYILADRIRIACRNAGLDIHGRKIDWYSLRYTYRSKMNHLLSESVRRQFMGHSSDDGSVHDGYLKILPEEQLRAIPQDIRQSVERFWD